MIQKEFARRVVDIVEKDPFVVGLAVGGSWLTGELDEYSDLDLILVTEKRISDDSKQMLSYAESFGDFISGFIGEHVGEPRLLICLYDSPLLHVDIKFLVIEELENRIEDPEILFERDGKISEVINNTNPKEIEANLQWMEDRFWTWVHYLATKIGRGEYFDALAGIEFLRTNVLSPLMQLKNKRKVRGMRKVEKELMPPDLENLKITVATYNRRSIVTALDNIISIYKSLRRKMDVSSITTQERAEKKSMEYFKMIKNKS